MKPKNSPKTIWLQGTVNWFNPETGRGSILGNDGNMYRIQDFSLVERKSRVKANSKVTFKLAQSSVKPIVESVRPLTKEQQRSRTRTQISVAKESVV